MAYLKEDIESAKMEPLVFLKRLFTNLEKGAYYSSFKEPVLPFTTDDNGIFPPLLEWYLEKALSVVVLTEEESELQSRVLDFVQRCENQEEEHWTAYENYRESELNEYLSDKTK